MPQDCSDKLMVHLKGTVYVATPSQDLTTMVTRRIRELTQNEETKRLKAMIVSAGTTN